MNIHNVRIYKIQIHGQVKEGEDSTFIAVRTDQSGLVGLVRHLHGLGLVLLSMSSSVEHPLDCCTETLDDKG
jgi:hypothetical protein